MTTRTDDTARHAEPDEPDKPASPTDLSKRSWKYVLRKTVREFGEDQCTDKAAALTYYAVLALFPMRLSFAGVEVVLVVAGLGLGTIYPISTTSVQNAVPMHQLGTVTGVLNFFRSLGSAILVAVMGAVFLATASARVTGTSIQAVILEGGGKGIDFGPIFGAVFWTATISSAIGLVFMILMKELPLRSHSHPPAVEAG